MDVIIIPLIEIVRVAISIYIWIIIIQAILSWLLAFRVVNPSNELVARVSYALYRLTEPVLDPIRRFLPNLGSVDISPIILLLGLWFVDGVLERFIYSL